MPGLAATIKVLGTPDITDELEQTITDGVLAEAANRSVDQLAREENEVLLGFLKRRTCAGSTASACPQDVVCAVLSSER